MRHKRSYHKHQSKQFNWWYLPVILISILIGWYAINRLFVLKGSILVQDHQHIYELWLDGNPTTLTKTDEGWLIKVVPGQHTITLQDESRRETKMLIKVRSGRTVSVTPPVQGEISTEDATFIGSASFAHLSADGKYLYYLNREGKTMRRYNIESGANVAISDAVFKNPTQISFSPDDSTATMRATSGAWYAFDFRKTDFTTSSFRPLTDNSVISMAFDLSRFRLGYIKPTRPGGALGFFTAEADMSGEHYETELQDLHSPRLIWSPHGRQIVMLDDPSYNRSNLHFFDLAKGERLVVPVQNVTRAEYSSDGRWLLVEEARGAERWLVVVNTETNEAREIGQLHQSWLAAWRPLENVIWANLEGTEARTITAIKPDGSRTTVGQTTDLPGVWQALIPTAASGDILIESSFEIWRVPITAK